MFKKKAKKGVRTQVPADLFVSIHSPQVHRKRWIVEILLSLVIVVGLLFAGMLIYKKVHQSSEPSSVPKSNAQQVMQSPQAKPDSSENTEVPAPTPASDSTNDGSVEQPE